MGRCEKRPKAIEVHVFEDGDQVARGKFYGYVNEKSGKVALYPIDYPTRCAYHNKKIDITIYDLKARCPRWF